MLQGLFDIQAGVFVDVGIGRTMPAFLPHYKMPGTARKQGFDSASGMAVVEEFMLSLVSAAKPVYPKRN